jgi:hypothetical protein
MLEIRIQFTPGEIPAEIHEDARQVLARLILDTSIELPPSGRGFTDAYKDLPSEEFAELYRPLVQILELNPAKDQPPIREHFERASKLGLTPSLSPIDDRGGLSKVQTELGFAGKFRFDEWTNNDLVRAGKRLAKQVGGRPTRDDMSDASQGRWRGRVGDFPSVDTIRKRFGKISTFHELMGYVRCNGWEHDDYMDWAYAFRRQNPEAPLAARTIDHLSSRGVGPSKQPIIKYFGGIAKFQKLADEEYERRIANEQVEQEERLQQTARLVEQGIIPEEYVMAISDPAEKLRTTGQFIIIRHLLPHVDTERAWQMSTKASPDEMVKWVVDRDPNITLAQIELTASAFNVFDDLWPMYRFQAVDLSVAA